MNYESKDCIERADSELRLYRECQDRTERAEIVLRELDSYRESWDCTEGAEIVQGELKLYRGS